MDPGARLRYKSNTCADITGAAAGTTVDPGLGSRATTLLGALLEAGAPREAALLAALSLQRAAGPHQSAPPACVGHS